MTSYYKTPNGNLPYNRVADYARIGAYNPSIGVPIISSVNADGSLNLRPNSENEQLIPVFSGVSYTNPNYNSLVKNSCYSYPSVTQGYRDKDCVKFMVRPCNAPRPPSPGPGPAPPKPPSPYSS